MWRLMVRVFVAYKREEYKLRHRRLFNVISVYNGRSAPSLKKVVIPIELKTV